MTWDNHARKLAIKTIGSVESEMKYDCIYYVDAITIGLVQFYAGWAAAVLEQLVDNPLWQNVPASLRNDLTNNPTKGNAGASPQWDYWANRYLTRAEGDALKPLLVSEQGIRVQNAQMFKDLDGYAKVALKLGLDANVDTEAFIFWATMYHQSPRQAKAVLNNAGDHPSVERLYTLCMNNKIFMKYKSRYSRAKKIIAANDVSGVPDPGQSGEVTPDQDDGGDNDTSTVTDGFIEYATFVGDSIHIKTNDGTVICVPTSGQYYLPNKRAASNGAGPDVAPPTDNPTPEIPPSSDADAKRAAVVKWMVDRIGKFGYSQGAGRMNPDKSGVGDCSSTVYRAYLDVCNIKLGANTEGQWQQGDLVWSNFPGGGGSGKVPPEELMKPGDLIYFRWPSSPRGRNVNHVEMYVGNDKIIGHGGNPYMGPNYHSFKNNCQYAQRVCVRRHIK